MSLVILFAKLPLPRSDRPLLLNFIASLLVMAGTSLAARAEDPWADLVVANNAIDPSSGFNTPSNTLGEPVGGGTFAANNSSQHSIGRPGPSPGSYITLKFNTPVTDDPANPMGLDCIVYGNSFWTGGDPLRKWVEPALIEISEDANNNGLADDPWYVIPGSRGLASAILPEGIANPAPPLGGNVLNTNIDGTERDWGYAELTPAQKKCRDNYVRPDDPFATGLTPRSGGGDAFDIAWALNDSGDPAGISQFHFIRLSAFIDVDNGPFGHLTPEIDAVADVAPEIDLDGDDILDEYETRVAGTDPARPESTVLPLEIPNEDGGSAAGSLLGMASTATGDGLALYSSGLRSGNRNFNCVVDIVSVSNPAPSLPGLLLAASARRFDASESDFSMAQVQAAEFTIAYSASDIFGLEETSLAPYRHDGVAYTQSGISSISRDINANTVTFRSQYPGVFVLMAPSGTGDVGGIPGSFSLAATPEAGIVGDPGTLATITSTEITDAFDQPVMDGTLFTVSSTLGTILDADLDAGTSGLQVASQDGMLSFQLQANTVAGRARITAESLDGLLDGWLDFDIEPGEAVAPVDVYLLDNQATAPGPIYFTTSIIVDEYSNPLPNGRLVTIASMGGAVQNTDASTAIGHQVAVQSGVLNFSVRLDSAGPGDLVPLYLALYADSAETSLLGDFSDSFLYVQLPLGIGLPVIMLLLVIGWVRLRRGYGSAGHA